MRQRHLNLTVCALSSAIWLVSAPLSLGQGAITTTANDLQADLPDTLTFTLAAESGSTIQDVKLNYGFNARTCQDGAAVQVPDFTPGKSIDASWTLDLRDSGSFPVGAEVWWTWDLGDASGATLTTDRETRRLTDDRFAWNRTTQGTITVEWHRGDQAFGQSLASIAAGALDRITRDAGLELTDPIRLTVYAEPAEISDIILFQPEWIGGLAFPEHNIVMAAIAPGEDAWAREVIPHELMHLVSGALTFNCFGASMPTWLSEGLSRFAEDAPDVVLAAQVREMALAGDLPPLTSLANAFSAFGNEARVSYEQSYEIVAFLIETHGADKMSTLLARIAGGSAVDAALTDVYGYTTQTLDSAWRESFGAPTRAAVVATPIAVPTLALWTPVVKPTATVAPSPTTAPSPTEPSAATGPTEAPVPPATSVPTPAPSTGFLPCGGGIGGVFGLLALGGLARLRRRRDV